jgi:lysophospholipid acyltransferase (LPLAT)-like uncharacterized protein
MPMSFFRKLRWSLIGILGKLALWLWAKSTRMKIIGEEGYKELRNKGKAVIFLVWHGRIFIVPYFFRKRGIMPLISPSQDGEIPAQIMSRWGYKNIRGSSSHAVIKVWNRMKNELKKGGEVIIVPDGPRGPDRNFLKSWDKFLIFYPFSKVIAVYGPPMNVEPALKDDALEKERQKIERVLIELDEKADRFYG